MKSLKSLSCRWLVSLSICLSELSFANPVLEHVEHGQVAVSQTDHSTQIHQSSEKAIIHWDSFNIHPEELTHFQQPAGGITLNRINSANGISTIQGRLTATGHIILINGAGIHFAPGSMVNVGGIIASTSNISSENFHANNYRFDQPGMHGAAVVNHGHIKAADHGLVALIGPRIENHGMIEANVGTVALASGNKVVLDFQGNQLIHFAVDEALMSAEAPKAKRGVEHSGHIIADGGKIYVSAAAAHQVLDHVINMKGVAQARSVSQRNGVIILHGGDEGRVRVTGRLDASSRSKQKAAGRLAALKEKVPSSGGSIQINGKDLQIEHAKIDVSGHAGGGEILIGGHPGQGTVLASTVELSSNVRLHADTLEQGRGGTIYIHSKEATEVHGHLSAEGGPKGGDGGSVETLSDHYINVDNMSVDLTARQGEVGTWQLEGQNLNVKSNRERVDSSSKQFSPIAAQVIEASLSKANVSLQSISGGLPHAGDLTVSTKLAWEPATTLSLQAYRNIDLLGSSISNHQGGTLLLQADTHRTGSGAINFIGESSKLQITGGGSLFLYESRPRNFDYSPHLKVDEATRVLVTNNNHFMGEPLEHSDSDWEDAFSDTEASPKVMHADEALVIHQDYFPEAVALSDSDWEDDFSELGDSPKSNSASWEVVSDPNHSMVKSLGSVVSSVESLRVSPMLELEEEFPPTLSSSLLRQFSESELRYLTLADINGIEESLPINKIKRDSELDYSGLGSLFHVENSVMPAQAGIQNRSGLLDASLRWHDREAGPRVDLVPVARPISVVGKRAPYYFVKSDFPHFWHGRSLEEEQPLAKLSTLYVLIEPIEEESRITIDAG